jgi:transcriptional regulator with XRE-family HTH domain
MSLRFRNPTSRFERKKKNMSRPFSRIVPAMPARRRNDKGFEEGWQDVKGLRELRMIAGKAQTDVATALRIKQPSVSKVESQTDMHVSTLRAYVEAIGGSLELIVRLPERPVARFYRLSDALGQLRPAARPAPSQRRRPTATG